MGREKSGVAVITAIMKKLSLILVILLIIINISCGVGRNDFSAPHNSYENGAPGRRSLQHHDDNEYYESFADGFLTEFVTKYPDRVTKNMFVSANNQIIAAYYLEEKFKEYNLEYYNGKDGYLHYVSIKNNYSSRNVVGVKKGNGKSDKCAIIGAHYDSVVETDGKGKYSAGALDNGTGVAALFTALEMLKDAEPLDFDIIFALFGAEELGLYGSAEFVKTLDKNSCLMMFNFDCVGGGDYLYLYCDEVPTKHEKFIHNIAAESGIELKNPPLDKKIIKMNVDFLKFPYIHTGFQSDNASFLQSGVNSAFFMRFNWDTNKYFGIVESVNNNPIMHSPYDDMDSLQKYYPDYAQNIAQSSKIVYNSITSEGFEAEMIKSGETKFHYDFLLSRLSIFICMVVVLLAFSGYVVMRYVRINYK